MLSEQEIEKRFSHDESVPDFVSDPLRAFRGVGQAVKPGRGPVLTGLCELRSCNTTVTGEEFFQVGHAPR